MLQAIARVNRLYDGKDFGYIIDYRGVLQNLNKAFDLYGKMEDYDQADLEGTLTDVAEEIDKLPRRHTDLLNLFQDIKNKQDEEQYERLLADDGCRERVLRVSCGTSAARCRLPCPRRGSSSRRPTPRSRSIARTWRSS